MKENSLEHLGAYDIQEKTICDFNLPYMKNIVIRETWKINVL